jgi:hypothetical protein
MNTYRNTTKSYIVVNNVDGNSLQIDEEYKTAFAKNEVEETTKLQFYTKKDGFQAQTNISNTKDDSQERKKKSEFNKTNKKKKEDSKGKAFISDDGYVTKTNKSKKNSNEIQNTFIGKKTKKGKNNEGKNDEEFKENKIKTNFNKDNSIKEAMKAFILIMKILIEILGDIIFNNFDCNDILGGVKQNELIRKANLYQILGYNKDYRKILRNAKPKNAEIFNYFLSRNFGFLFEKYFLNDRKFEINGKEESVKEFKTLKDELKRRREKVYNEDDENTRKEKINNFIYSSFLVFNDFKGCQSREVKAKKGLIDYRENRIEKFFIYSKKEKNSESNCEQEKEKFIYLISKTNEELNNDNTLKSEFAFFEEKENGFEEFMSIRQIIEEKEKKGIQKVTQKKIFAQEDSIFNSWGKIYFTKEKSEKNETTFDNLFEESFNNSEKNDENLEHNSQEQKKIFEQGEIENDPNSFDSYIGKVKPFLFDINYNHLNITSQENNNQFNFPNFENISTNFCEFMDSNFIKRSNINIRLSYLSKFWDN